MQRGENPPCHLDLSDSSCEDGRAPIKFSPGGDERYYKTSSFANHVTSHTQINVFIITVI